LVTLHYKKAKNETEYPGIIYGAIGGTVTIPILCGSRVRTQYRSAIFYHNVNQEKLARYYIAKLDASKAYQAKIATQLEPFHVFYNAEQYHQDYYNNNQDKSYCLYVIKLKLDKFRAVFKTGAGNLLEWAKQVLAQNNLP